METTIFPLRNSKFAFTLIELLVVIAIIAILAAILFPVFGRARENARRSSCQSNLKQISLGILQYVQDYDEQMPPLFTDGGGTVGFGGINDRAWPQLVFPYPYVKSAQLFQCPSEGSSPNPSLQTTFATSDPSLVGTAYGLTDYAINRFRPFSRKMRPLSPGTAPTSAGAA